MGLGDNVRAAVGDIEFDEPHAWGNGFDNEVCMECQHWVTDRGPNKCGLCGCPTHGMAPMSLTGAPPESCPYLDEHADKSSE